MNKLKYQSERRLQWYNTSQYVTIHSSHDSCPHSETEAWGWTFDSDILSAKLNSAYFIFFFA
jgi:hypothetical protein